MGEGEIKRIECMIHGCKSNLGTVSEFLKDMRKDDRIDTHTSSKINAALYHTVYAINCLDEINSIEIDNKERDKS